MSRPWMPFYVADYLADTGHLTTIEHGAYMLLIMHYWQKGGLPDDDKRLASIARATPEQWADMREAVAEFFEPGWKHPRIEDELEKSTKAYERRAAAGRAGGKAKAHNQQSSSNASSNAKAPLYHPQSHTKIEKEAPNGASKKRGTRLPDDIEPDIQAALSEGLSEAEARREIAKFRDYWRSIPGQKGVKLDWPATWRNWCRKAADDRRPRGGHSPPSQAPRNVGERSFLKLQAEYENEPTDTTSGHLEAGDGRRETEGAVHAGPTTGAPGAFGRN